MDATRTADTARLRAATSELVRALDVRRRVQTHPYGALAAALGVGYVLGGGLFTRLTARLLKTGVRVSAELATLPLLAKAYEDLSESTDPKVAGHEPGGEAA
jgi:hypothetical protein